MGAPGPDFGTGDTSTLLLSAVILSEVARTIAIKEN
jgi:hypothetical protein